MKRDKFGACFFLDRY